MAGLEMRWGNSLTLKGSEEDILLLYWNILNGVILTGILSHTLLGVVLDLRLVPLAIGHRLLQLGLLDIIHHLVILTSGVTLHKTRILTPLLAHQLPRSLLHHIILCTRLWLIIWLVQEYFLGFFLSIWGYFMDYSILIAWKRQIVCVCWNSRVLAEVFVGFIHGFINWFICCWYWLRCFFRFSEFVGFNGSFVIWLCVILLTLSSIATLILILLVAWLLTFLLLIKHLNIHVVSGGIFACFSELLLGELAAETQNIIRGLRAHSCWSFFGQLCRHIQPTLGVHLGSVFLQHTIRIHFINFLILEGG